MRGAEGTYGMQVLATIGLVPVSGSELPDAALAARARQLLLRAGLRGGLGERAAVHGDAAAVLVAARRLRTLVQAEAGHLLAAVICLGGASPPLRPALATALHGDVRGNRGRPRDGASGPGERGCA